MVQQMRNGQGCKLMVSTSPFLVIIDEVISPNRMRVRVFSIFDEGCLT